MLDGIFETMRLFLLTLALMLLARSVAADRPNIVFMLADDMGYGDLACYGNPVIQSPNLDQLAEEGVRLLNCYAASPNCSPARTAIMTGRSPYRVGMYDWARYKPMHIPSDELTLPEVIGGAGYQTMFAGKWHCSGDSNLISGTQPNPGDHGFDHWLAHPRNFGENPRGFFRNGEALDRLEGWMSEIVVDEATNFIGNRDPERPFMSVLWFSEPHTPVEAAREFIEPYETAEVAEKAKTIKKGGPQVNWGSKEGQGPTYYGCVSMLDYHVGRLMEFLDEQGLRDNTIVIFTSDNGPEHRPGSSFGSPGDLRGAKGHMHEGGYKVPGIIRWPGKIEAGSTSREPVNGTDFLPSFAATARADYQPDKVVDGVNVFPALVDGEPLERPVPMMWWLYHARGAKEVTMRVGDYKILANMLPQKEITVNDAAPPQGMPIMEFIKEAELGNFTMYNLKDDPNETRDLSKSQPEKLEELKKQMIQLHDEIRAEGPVYDLGAGKKR
jgi:arylsulfatase A